MPDQAKFNLLNEIKYKSVECCGLCINFSGRPGAWGICNILTYTHEKHGNRQLGVHSYGVCSSFELADTRATKMLQSYTAL